MPEEVWACNVSANDGTESGPDGTALVTIQNNCGDSEPGTPIYDCDDLQAMSDDLSETYCLVTDIECSAIADFVSVGSTGDHEPCTIPLPASSSDTDSRSAGSKHPILDFLPSSMALLPA